MTVEVSAEFAALVLQAWQGEVYGVEVYGAIAERRKDHAESAKFNELVELEEHMEQRLSQVLVDLEIEPDFGDVMATAEADVAEVALRPWSELMSWLASDAETALLDYTRMIECAPLDAAVRAVVVDVVAHERALIWFCQRELGGESDSLADVRALLVKQAS